MPAARLSARLKPAFSESRQLARFAVLTRLNAQPNTPGGLLVLLFPSRRGPPCSAQAAAEAGHGVVLLVGDEPYFRKLDFVAVPSGQVTLPGPANPRRTLWRALRPGATDGVAGLVQPG